MAFAPSIRPEKRHPAVPRSRVALGALLVLAASSPVLAQFTDVSDPSGLTVGDVTYGLGWGDFDLDGALDLLVCRHFFRPLMYRNSGAGSFNFSFFPPLFDVEDFHGPLVADFDDDGDLDIYLTGGTDAGASSIPKQLYRNDGNFTFRDVALEWGVADSLSRGRSSSATDLESDGDVDFFVAKAPRTISPNSLFLNDGVPTSFTDIAATAGLADDFGSVGGIWGDYDRDGDPDLLIGGEEQSSFETRLYRNEGNLTFTDVTATALPGLGRIASAAWADYDKDGDLDLAVGLGDEGLFDAITWSADSIRFFFNARGNDNGLDGLGFFQEGDSASFDLYLNGFYLSNSIFISESGFHPGPTTPFVVGNDITGAPFFLPGQSVGYYLWTSLGGAIWEMRCNTPPAVGSSFAGAITTVNGPFTDLSSTSIEPYSHGPRGARLWRNEGDGTFTDVSTAAGLTDSVNVRHLGWADVDLDGNLDLYVLNKGDTEVFNQPNVFYRNLGDGTFEDQTTLQGLEGPSEGLGDAFGFEDYDGDGDLDLMITSGTGPRFFARLEQHRLYRNDGPVGNHLRVDLEGFVSTRDAYGAWVTCVSATAGRQTRYVAGNAWRGSPEMIDPFFGLGADTIADSLIVEWPFTGRTVLTKVPAGGTVLVVEPDPTGAPPPSPRPGELRLAVRPNPARGRTLLLMPGRESGRGELEIFDAGGRRVRRWTLSGDVDRVSWDARDGAGHPVGAGVYFARLRQGGRTTRAKIVLLQR